MRPYNRIRSIRRERGQILILVALLSTVLVGLVGLVVDAGFLFAQRRAAQNGADAAALAGAQLLWEGGTQFQARAAASDYAHDNGYADAQTEVNFLPPDSPSAVEVTVEEQPDSFFIHLIIPGAKTVRARAVADTVDIPREYGLIVLDQDACAGYDQGGTGSVIIDEGGAMINADCDQALDKGGSGLFNVSGEIDVTGGADIDGGDATVEPEPRTYVPWTLDDPLLALEPPDVGAPSPSSPGTPASPDRLLINSPGVHVLQPGTYYGGIWINCSNCRVIFESGIFVMAGGGFTVAANPIIEDEDPNSDSDDGVLIYLTDCNGPNDPNPNEPDGPPACQGNGIARPLDFQGGARIKLTGLHYCRPFGPPCTSPYQNTRITFWQDAAIDDQVRFAGDAGGTTGIWYIPSAELVATGTSDFGSGQVIVDSFTKSGTGNITITYEAFVEINLPLVLLIE